MMSDHTIVLLECISLTPIETNNNILNLDNIPAFIESQNREDMSNYNTKYQCQLSLIAIFCNVNYHCEFDAVINNMCGFTKVCFYMNIVFSHILVHIVYSLTK